MTIDDYILRSMQADDVPAVLQIERLTTSHPWTSGIFNDCLSCGYGCQVVEMEGEVVAFVILSIAANEAHILNIAVKPDHQRQGVGRYCLDQIISTALTAKIQRIFLEVRVSNIAAIALYQSLGFKRIGVRQAYYPGPEGKEDGLVYSLTL